MHKFAIPLALATLLALSGCTSQGIHYSRALFEHIPDDPELLVLVKPNDLTTLAEVAIDDFNLDDFLANRLNLKTGSLDNYKNITSQMLEAIGIPWPQVESVGFLRYFGQVVVLVSGEFTKVDVEGKLLELGFKQDDQEYIEYIYSGQKLYVPEDGLIMLAAEELLGDLRDVPRERRLWERQDFADYRTTSPLDNSLFVWSTPPEDFLTDFRFRDDLGDVSLAIDFSGSFSLKGVIRVKDPSKAVYLHDIMFGSVKVAGGFFGDDPDYGPVFRGINVTLNNSQVETSLVVPASKLGAVKTRIMDDIQNPNSKTFQKFENFMGAFR